MAMQSCQHTRGSLLPTPREREYRERTPRESACARRQVRGVLLAAAPLHCPSCNGMGSRVAPIRVFTRGWWCSVVQCSVVQRGVVFCSVVYCTVRYVLQHHKLVEHAPNTPDVGFLRVVLAHAQLGRHVHWSACRGFARALVYVFVVLLQLSCGSLLFIYIYIYLGERESG